MVQSLGSIEMSLGVDTTNFITSIKKSTEDIRNFTQELKERSRAASGSLTGISGAVGGMQNKLSSLAGTVKNAFAFHLITEFASKIRESSGEIAETIGKYEKLNTGLQLIEGNAGAAGVKFSELKKYADATGQSVEAVAQAYVKLKNFGIKASEETITALSNVAIGSQKSLDQLVEAVADAQGGEFARLVEFGIKAKKEGDNISFTFRGVKESVKGDSDAILSYFNKLGNNQFGGAVDLQAKTMSQSFVKLKDAADNLIVSLGNYGLTDIIRTLTLAAADSLNVITKWVNSFNLFGGVTGEFKTHLLELQSEMVKTKAVSTSLAATEQENLQKSIDLQIQQINNQNNAIETRKRAFFENQAMYEKEKLRLQSSSIFGIPTDLQSTAITDEYEKLNKSLQENDVKLYDLIEQLKLVKKVRTDAENSVKQMELDAAAAKDKAAESLKNHADKLSKDTDELKKNAEALKNLKGASLFDPLEDPLPPRDKARGKRGNEDVTNVMPLPMLSPFDFSTGGGLNTFAGLDGGLSGALQTDETLKDFDEVGKSLEEMRAGVEKLSGETNKSGEEMRRMGEEIGGVLDDSLIKVLKSAANGFKDFGDIGRSILDDLSNKLLDFSLELMKGNGSDGGLFGGFSKMLGNIFAVAGGESGGGGGGGIFDGILSGISGLFGGGGGVGGGDFLSGLFTSGGGGFGDLAAGAGGAAASFGSDFSSLGSSLMDFGGFFADGGDFRGGKPIVVGERGPEIIMPSGPGRVIPNEKAFGGGQNISVTMNISTPDAQGFRKSQSQILADMYRGLQNVGPRVT
jgi:hypothetical protein